MAGPPLRRPRDRDGAGGFQDLSLDLRRPVERLPRVLVEMVRDERPRQPEVVAPDGIERHAVVLVGELVDAGAEAQIVPELALHLALELVAPQPAPRGDLGRRAADAAEVV